jgi:hypothetical protein
MKSLFTTLLLSLLSLTTFAAGPGSFGLWPAYYGSGAINNRLGIWLELQPRMYDFEGDLEQVLARAAITYNLTNDGTVQLAQGYGYIRSEPYISGTENKRVTEEHRVYQQLILRQRWGRFYLQHRYRLEERFLQDDFRVRLRYFLSGNLCLNAKEMKPGTAFLSAYNEVFLHTDRPVFDRNRLYGGLGYVFNKNFRLEAGGMWQMQEAVTRPQLQIILWHNFKL